MIHRIMTWCAGYVLVRLPGAQAERFVNICRAKGIVWWGLRWQQDQRMVYGYLRRSDYYKLRPIAAKTGVFPLVRERIGGYFCAKRNGAGKLLVRSFVLSGNPVFHVRTDLGDRGVRSVLPHEGEYP